MKKFCLICCLVIAGCVGFAQPASERIRNAVSVLVNDPQLRHAQISFIVLDAKTGKEIYGVNTETGLVPASTQKVLTAIAAFDLMGPSFRYTTSFSILNNEKTKVLLVTSSGDPTLGSNRWQQTGESAILGKIRAGLGTAGIEPSAITAISFFNPGYSSALVPEGWIWQDIGNYYGAGSHSFNWRENQFDILFKTGNAIGDPVTVSGTSPSYAGKYHFDVSELKTAAKGSGDNGYVFFDVWNNNGFRVNGTLPAGESKFPISAAHPHPSQYFIDMLMGNGFPNIKMVEPSGSVERIIYQHQSPSLDSMVYWFLQKSINLYGEALIQTIAMKQTGKGLTASGVKALQEFWRNRGIDTGALHIMDGSGLSPLNRVSSKALATALLYARRQPWYPAFYKALPLINGQHMKSGFIEGARSYAGYQQSKDGHEYVFAIIVNNYEGSSSVTRKLWTVLNMLK
ncbi:MAG TPA: D-alanyl-D-alanine carboxypeptidase/D-alanyl-D-alanine-endopeptidase [Flavitalea sp.]|nr:D-alanyl-D-alanine carboxypeptidase/D-alanyl-D-alanine-endopeptidase [Flavitalea sp.]